MADAEGRYSFQRNFRVSSDLADALERVWTKHTPKRAIPASFPAGNQMNDYG